MSKDVPCPLLSEVGGKDAVFLAQVAPQARVQTWEGGTGGDLQVVYWGERRFRKEVGEGRGRGQG